MAAIVGGVAGGLFAAALVLCAVKWVKKRNAARPHEPGRAAGPTVGEFVVRVEANQLHGAAQQQQDPQAVHRVDALGFARGRVRTPTPVVAVQHRGGQLASLRAINVGVDPLAGAEPGIGAHARPSRIGQAPLEGAREYHADTMREALAGLVRHAEGGSADVYMAELEGRTVAVKAIKTGSMAAAYAAGFRQEISILGSCRHPNVVELLGYSAEPSSGSLWLVYAWMNGEDLHNALGSPGLALTDHERVKICVDVADGLMFCHSGCGGVLPGTLLHRDIKPANILLNIQTSQGSPRTITARLGDFGLSKLYESREVDLHTHQQFGTPGYIAPEVANGVVAPSGKADVYSFGVVILQVATGLEFRVDTGGGRMIHISSQTQNWLRAHLLRPWSNVAALNSLLEVGIACTAVNPSERLDLVTARTRLARALDTYARGARECLYCYERPRNARIMSCGHLALCMECAGTVAAAGFPCLVCQAAFTLANVAAAEPGEVTYLPRRV